ncbi:hypothetical protein FNF27_05592 [Cafeteria roenbergensis]|uniref:Uncharacterized protein n=1 Tax=Cafeteria roenbergensis TaxID=33653 RepID=A0A5A8E585_CAFRO|nr:hypothetical protein FNF27_05592 [Cafeteria roenbergensis]
MRTAAITAALDEVAAIDPATCEPWGGVRRVWQEGESTPAASVFWVEPFAGRRVLVVATRSRRLLNGWLAAHALRPARRRRRAAERAGAASPVYSSADGTPLPADEVARRLGLGPAAPVWGPGGAAADAAYLSDVPDAAFLDGPALLRVADTEAAAAAWILGLDAEWSDAVPATTRKGRQQRPATLDSVWGLAGDGAVPLRLPRVPGAADVIQLATHNAVLVASLTHMDHHDDPDDPAEVVEPPFDRRVRGRHFDGRVPKFRAPAAMLEARSWALRDFLAVTGIGVMLDTEKEAAAVAAEQYDCPQAQGLDLRWPLKAAGAGRFNRGLQAAAQLLTGALPWKAKSVSTSRWSQWPLTSDQCL